MGTPSTNMAGALASVEKALAAKAAAKPRRRSEQVLARLRRSIEETLREAYLAEIRALADKLASDFTAHKFDPSYADPNNDDDHREYDLLCLVRGLPMCTDTDSAHVVLFSSPNAARAIFVYEERGTPTDGRFLARMAAECVVIDLTNEAVARGWQKSGFESFRNSDGSF